MGDGFSVTIVTDHVTAALKDRQTRMRRATLYALRESGRVAQRAAKAQAPVLKGGAGFDSNAARRRGAKFRRRGGFGPIQGQGGPIPGLLRASISPSKNLKDTGGGWSIKVGPRGQRVHLYAGKAEARAHFMAAGHQAAAAAAGAVAAKAYQKVWKA